MSKPPRILTIAGSDSSGGAGIQADIKTITMLGGYAMTAITAITAQNTLGVSQVIDVAMESVSEQAAACLNDIGVDAIKIGMLATWENANLTANIIEASKTHGLIDPNVPVVFDPVLIATSGDSLATRGTVDEFNRLMKLAALSTPNTAELAALGGHDALQALGVTFLAKGGDADGSLVEDVLFRPGHDPLVMSAPRIETRHTHGTGCTLSSAIATELGRGVPIVKAIELGRAFVRAALLAAPGFGQGHGPLGHAAVRL